MFAASQSSWLRYDDDKIFDKVANHYRAALGSEIHEYAATEIKLRHKPSSVKALKDGMERHIYLKYYNESIDELSEFGKKLLYNLGYLPKEVWETLRTYIVDGSGYFMEPEQVVAYDDVLFYGTADALIFRDNTLRIHDLKTGVQEAHVEQLAVYAAYFCLENKIKPRDIDIELRIYQNAQVNVFTPDATEIEDIMHRVIDIYKMVSGSLVKGV